MYRVIVEATSKTTANLEANRIVEDDGFFKVFNGEELVGAFDVGSVCVIYKTKSKANAKERSDGETK